MGRGPFGSYADEPLAASGAWTGDNTFVAKICARETPFIATLNLVFNTDQVTLDFSTNVGFGPNRPTQLVGRAERPLAKP